LAKWFWKGSSKYKILQTTISGKLKENRAPLNWYMICLHVLLTHGLEQVYHREKSIALKQIAHINKI
jgi:hypothetical protein